MIIVVNRGDNMRVGLFDSGMGGLTVLKTLIKKYPDNDYIYYGDNLNVPYGNKSIDELLVLADNNIKFLLKQNVDIIIIACGTVSSTCYDKIKNNYLVPIYNVITPTIDYLNKSDVKNILVIATSRTIDSHIFKNNIEKNVYELAIPELATLIENNELSFINQFLHSYLNEYRNKVDTVVLGCTHYPLITLEIEKVLPNTKIIDMASQLKLDNVGNKQREIYFTKVDDKIIKNIKNILNDDEILIHLAMN